MKKPLKFEAFFSSKIFSAIACILAVYLAYAIIRDQWDPFQEKLRILKTGDANERASVLQDLNQEMGRHWQSHEPYASQDKVLSLDLQLLTSDPSYLVRREAVPILGKIPKGHRLKPRVTRAILEALSDKDPTVRTAAAIALRELKPPAKVVGPPLIALAMAQEGPKLDQAKSSWFMKTSGDWSEVAHEWMLFERARMEAISTLAEIASNDEQMMGAMEQLAQDENRYIRSIVAGVLWRCEPGSPKTWAVLDILRHDPSPGVRARALSSVEYLAFGSRAPRAYISNASDVQKTALAWFIEAIKDDSPVVIFEVVTILDELKPAPRAALPALIAFAGKECPSTIPTSGKTDLIRHVYSYYQDPDLPLVTPNQARARVIRHISKFARDVEPVGSLLIQLGSHPDNEIRLAAATTLWNLAKKDAASISTLRRLTTDAWQPSIRAVAIEAVADLDPDDFAVFSALRSGFQDTSENVCKVSFELLKKIFVPGRVPAGFISLEDLWQAGPAERLVFVLAADPETSSGCDTLLRSLKDKDPRVRSEAVVKLDQCPEEHAAAALNALKEVADDPRVPVRQWAEIVADRIRKRVSPGKSPLTLKTQSH